MKLVTTNHKQYQPLFQNYEHSIPIIYSSIEGQYSCYLYVDHLDNPTYGLLFTQFDFNYLGYINAFNIDQNEVKQTIKNHIKAFDVKECIMFAPTQEGELILESIFKSFNGVVDERFTFKLDIDEFKKISKCVNVDNAVLEYCKDYGARIEYPKCEIYLDEKLVSYAKAFMIGQSSAEIDVFTDESHRRKGYAQICSIRLIQELLKNGIKPNWNAWWHKESSHLLAGKLGFKFERKINAYVWVDEFGEL